MSDRNPKIGYSKADLTGFFEGCIKPIRVGVYYVTTKDLAGVGGAYEYWSGTEWIAFRNWGRFSNRIGFVWQGLNKEFITQPEHITIFN